MNTSAWKLNEDSGNRAGGIALAILAAFLAAFVAIGDARADGENAGGDDNWHIGGKCSGSHAIPHTSSTCLHAWWDNSPSAALVSTAFGAQSHCSSYGTVVAEIRLERGTNEHFHIPDADKIRGSDNYRDVDNVYCCLNHSDLCWKKQVEKNDEGEISHITTPSSSILTETPVDVSTHWARYRFCQANPDYIYCTVDPEGDANTEPEGPACAEDESCNCGDHYCSAADCESQWDSSTPASRGLIKEGGISDIHGCAPSNDTDYTSHFSATIDASDGTSQTCTMRVVCGVGDRRNTYVNGAWRRETTVKWVEFTADVEDVDRYYNCAGVLYKTSCGSAVTSTHIEDITHTTIE